MNDTRQSLPLETSGAQKFILIIYFREMEKAVLEYLQARVDALQNQLELQKQINAVRSKIPIDPKRALWIIMHLNNEYKIPMNHIAERLGVTREWLRLNLKEEALNEAMQNRVRDMVEDMISDLQMTLVEDVSNN